MSAKLSATKSLSFFKFLNWILMFPQSLYHHVFISLPLNLYHFPLISICSDLISSVQFSSVPELCLTLCNPKNCIMPGLPVYHQIPGFTQTHVHWVSDAINPSHPLLSPSPAFNLSQYQGLFQWVSSLHQVSKVLEFQLQGQFFQWIFRTEKNLYINV